MTEAPQPLPELFPPADFEPPVWKQALLLSGGVVFVGLGVIGWLVPIVSGIPFYLIAIVLFGASSPRVAALLNRTEARLPHRWRVGLRKVLRRKTA